MAAAQRDMAAISAKRLKLAEKQDLESLLTLHVADIDEECQAYFRACRAKELQIAMLKLQREEEEEVNAISRGTNRTPLPFVPLVVPPMVDVGAESESSQEQSPGYVPQPVCRACRLHQGIGLLVFLIGTEAPSWIVAFTMIRMVSTLAQKGLFEDTILPQEEKMFQGPTTLQSELLPSLTFGPLAPMYFLSRAPLVRICEFKKE